MNLIKVVSPHLLIEAVQYHVVAQEFEWYVLKPIFCRNVLKYYFEAVGPCKALIYEVVDHVMVRDQHILKKHMANRCGMGTSRIPSSVSEGRNLRDA